MDSKTLKEKYLSFFAKKEHAIIPGASLLPENDPTVLFTTAGMHPLVPFLMGAKHSKGNRLTDVQLCIRTGDIDEVGDATHLSFFEMLGNWSLGDYFKKEAIEWSYEFITKVLGLDAGDLHVTVFEGDSDAPKDEESAAVWRSLGIPDDRIYFLPKADNWWGPAGETGPCGPDSEMFIDTGKEKCSSTCIPGCNCGKWFEIWNDVFMGYEKTYRTLLVDGMGCLYDDNFQLNSELLAFVDSYPGKKVLVVNKFADKAAEILKNHNFEVFSFDGKINKNETEFFKQLMKKYGLECKDLIYFDHSQDNIGTASMLGIKSLKWDGRVEDIEVFVHENKFYYKELKQKNVDTGMGVERTIAMLNGKKNVFEIETFVPIVEAIKSISGIVDPSEKQEKSIRVISDHMRASVFILADPRSVLPSNTDQGYILRRFIRRSVRHGRLLGISGLFLDKIANAVIESQMDQYAELKDKRRFILDEIKSEEEKFNRTLEKGLKQFEKIASDRDQMHGKDAFLLFQSYGFPIEMVQELCEEKEIDVNVEEFWKEFELHQNTSRKGAEKRFKGGLADNSEETTKLHTATHLLNEALRKVISLDIKQRGSNITPERLRFDFNFNRKLTPEEKKEVEDCVNEVISKELDVERMEMPLSEALEMNAQAEFGVKYPDQVSVYKIGDFSMELCGGPHVKNTGDIGHFRIVKEESVAAGVRRIKAVVE